jgi:hypothetical protein
VLGPVTDACRMAGQSEWDEFESTRRLGREAWLLANPHAPAAAALRVELDDRLTKCVTGYRGILGFCYLVPGRYVPNRRAASSTHPGRFAGGACLTRRARSRGSGRAGSHPSGPGRRAAGDVGAVISWLDCVGDCDEVGLRRLRAEERATSWVHPSHRLF